MLKSLEVKNTINRHTPKTTILKKSIIMVIIIITMHYPKQSNKTTTPKQTNFEQYKIHTHTFYSSLPYTEPETPNYSMTKRQKIHIHQNKPEHLMQQSKGMHALS